MTKFGGGLKSVLQKRTPQNCCHLSHRRSDKSFILPDIYFIYAEKPYIYEDSIAFKQERRMSISASTRAAPAIPAA